MKLQLLVAISGSIIIVGATGCGPSGVVATSTSATSAAAPAPSPCASLGGTLESDGTCHVHSETPTYAIDIGVPVDYPDMRPVTDYVAQRRDEFSDWLQRYPVPGGIRSALHIDGRSYDSPGTTTLVLTVGTEGGVHPVTTYKSFNYDLRTHTPITFDTLFKPDNSPLEVLNPAVQRELDGRGATDVSSAGAGVDAYQNFALTDDSVIFFIDQDGPFPHYVGPLEIRIPRGDLAPLLTGSGAVPPCADGQVTVTAGPPQAAATHRAVNLTFSLAAGSSPCTLTGYPGVDTGAGGTLVHAQRLPRGYMGGLPEGVTNPPTATLSSSTPARAVVEGRAVDQNGDQCPTYTELRVTPPNSTQTSTVPTTIDTCILIVHPVT